MAERPSLALYVNGDNKHPSPAGSYLAACTFFAAFSGRPPEETAAVESFLPDGLTAADARFLRATAWRIVAGYYGWPLE